MNKKRILVLMLCVVVLLLCILIGIRYVTVELGQEDKPTYTVNFYSDAGNLLLIDTVIEGETAAPPAVPDMTYGNVFKRWEQDFTHVNADMDVYPVTESADGRPNVFAIHSAYGKSGDSLVIPFQLCGDVCLCGFDLLVKYDPESLLLEGVLNEDGGLLYNTETPGEVYMNLVSTENIEADIDICWLKFKILTGDSAEVPLSVTISSIYELRDNESDESNDTALSSNEPSVAMQTPEYDLITGTVYVLQ